MFTFFNVLDQYLLVKVLSADRIKEETESSTIFLHKKGCQPNTDLEFTSLFD